MFRVGDKVRVKVTGREGAIFRKSPLFKDAWVVQIENNNALYLAHELELVESNAESSPQYKVGDKVRVRRIYCGGFESEGTIFVDHLDKTCIRYNDSGGWDWLSSVEVIEVLASADGGNVKGASAEEIVYDDDIPAKDEPKRKFAVTPESRGFQVGDRVRYKNTGERATLVEKVTNYTAAWYAQFDDTPDDEYDVLFESEIELIAPAASTTKPRRSRSSTPSKTSRSAPVTQAEIDAAWRGDDWGPLYGDGIDVMLALIHVCDKRVSEGWREPTHDGKEARGA